MHFKEAGIPIGSYSLGPAALSEWTFSGHFRNGLRLQILRRFSCGPRGPLWQMIIGTMSKMG